MENNITLEGLKKYFHVKYSIILFKKRERGDKMKRLMLLVFLLLNMLISAKTEKLIWKLSDKHNFRRTKKIFSRKIFYYSF